MHHSDFIVPPRTRANERPSTAYLLLFPLVVFYCCIFSHRLHTRTHVLFTRQIFEQEVYDEKENKRKKNDLIRAEREVTVVLDSSFP